MTIKQMADKLGVTPQAIYQRLKKNGVQISTLIDRETKELTGEAEVIIGKLYGPDQSEIKPTKQSVIDALNEQVQTLRTEKAVLLERIKSLEESVSSLKSDKESLTTALDKAQELHKQTITLLPAPGQVSQTSEKLTWKERLTGRRRG